jgi:threonyl-tRNA synthetase
VSLLQVRKELRGCHLHVDADVTDRKMQKKVREAQLAQYNYILVVGEQEKVRRRWCWLRPRCCLFEADVFVCLRPR